MPNFNVKIKEPKAPETKDIVTTQTDEGVHISLNGVRVISFRNDNSFVVYRSDIAKEGFAIHLQ